MPTVTGPDGVEKEISMEEFMEAMSRDGSKLIGIERVVTDGTTGEELGRTEVPVDEEGNFDLFSALFGGGLFGGLMDERTLEEKIAEAEDGDMATMEELALLFLNGDEDTPADPEKGVYWFAKLAELDDSDAQFNLALHYAKGHGVERDFEKAAYWAERAAENGDDDAPMLAEKYHKWAIAAARVKDGDAQAMADLAGGLMELGGSLDQAGVGRDYAEAFELAQKAARMNNGDGLWVLALAYEHGRGVEQDVEKAVECYRKGAELGHAPSQHSRACYYMRGDVVGVNKPLAMELCQKSAQQGYGLAYFFLAKAYETGDGVEEDLDKALEWGEKAAEVGTPDVQYEVAKMYTYCGVDGGMPGAKRARYWLRKAAERGHDMAYSMLNFAPMWDGADIDLEDEGT